MQAYALVHKLREFGVSAELIDYRNKELEKVDSARKFLTIKKPERWVYEFVEMPFWFNRRRKFDSFLVNEIGVSKRVYSIDDNSTKKYDRIIVGSDQVWNPNITDQDASYFLNQVSDSKKKTSYAASFGLSSLAPDFYSSTGKMLRDFSHISVREPAGQKIVHDACGIDSEINIDPSLLLSKQEWLNLISDQTSLIGEKKPFLVVYQRAYSKKLVEFAKQVAKANGLRILTITGNPRQWYKARYVLNAGPLDFINLIANAKYVITNSFHGIAMSLALNKEVFIEYLDSKFGVNSRIENLVELFDLRSRLIDNISSLNNMARINYDVVNMVLIKQRILADQYFEKVLGSARYE